MAALTHEITIRKELRPVYVKKMQNQMQYTEIRGLFHGWITDAYPAKDEIPSGQMTKTYGLVEFEDGTVKRIRVRDIRFLDTGHIMGSIAWENDTPETEYEEGEEWTEQQQR